MEIEFGDSAAMADYVAFYNRLKPHRAIVAADEQGRLLQCDHHHLLAMRDDDGTIRATALTTIWKGEPHAWLSVLHDGSDPEHFIPALAAAAGEHPAVAGVEDLFVVLVEGDRAQHAWWEARGFEHFSEQLQSALEIDSRPLPPDIMPEGMHVATLADRPDLARAAHAIRGEATEDIPGDENDRPLDFEEWEQLLDRIGCRPEHRMVLVAADGEVVGFASVHPREATPGRLRHGMTAIARAHRGKGYGRVFKHYLIRQAAAQGCTHLATTNELRNAPIRHLNDSLGYLPEPAIIVLKGDAAAVWSRPSDATA